MHDPGASLSNLSSPSLSRRQLDVRAKGRSLDVTRTGRIGLSVNGKATDRATIGVGDTIVLEDELVLVCVERARGLQGGRAPTFAFASPDAHGIVGESVASWALRDAIDFYARREGHALVTGPSGAGKELAARAIHAQSGRRGPFVARNAATLPPGIVDAELFGNARDYPNAGMRERDGLIGEAHHGTLFLDEIGELPEALQAHLLRVLDRGEYHRLGEDRTRTADLRVIAATNRDEETLKHDLLARFKLRIAVPGLDARLDDVPLLARAQLQRIAATDPELRRRYFDGAGEARLTGALVTALLAQRYTGHARELERLLLLAMATSSGDVIELTDDVRARLQPRTQGREPDRAEITEALERAGGNVSRAWRSLGLSSRDALNRLLKKHGLSRRATGRDAG